MRGILFGLVFSNFLYLGWGIVVERRELALVEAAQPGVVESGVMLISEADSGSLIYYPAQNSGLPVGLQPPAVEGAPVAEYCAEIGPFESTGDAEGFVGTNASRFAMVSEVRRIPAAPDYRVYLPPFASRELAASTLTALREAFTTNGLTIDSFLISRGELENGIALGLFSEQRNALNVQAQLERLGYRVIIAEEEKFREEVWVLVSGVESEVEFDRHWAEIQLSRSYIQAGEKLCETIAHGL